MLFGSSYYHEYQPVERLELDLDLMVEAGFTVIRVGESTWSSFEPSDGAVSFEALKRVIAAAAARGLKVIIATPTYAVPPWLARAHPEVMAMTSTTAAVAYGGRQNVDFTNETYLRYAERIIRAMMAELAAMDGVIGVQVDNEIGVYQLTNPGVVERFRDHVLRSLGSIDNVNTNWGLTYWSQRIASREDIWAPDGNTNPGYALEWTRFQAALTSDFLAWQARIVREYLRPEQFVMHDVVGGDSLGSTDLLGIANVVDQVGANIYLPMQAALALPDGRDPDLIRLAPWWLTDAGPSVSLWKADMAFSLKGEGGTPFAVTESQAGSIGEHAINVPPYPGQLRLIAHEFASRGADLLAYWQWNTLHYGNEMYWGGVLGHDLEPGRIYAEIAQLGSELGRIAPQLAGLTPDADVAILYSRDSLKAFEIAPALQGENVNEPDSSSYHRILMRLYSAAVDSGAQVRIVHQHSRWSDQRVLIVPALYIADDALLRRLVEHARTGAHVILTFRSGYADEWSRARWTTAPGPVREGVGAHYREYTTLTHSVDLVERAVDGMPPIQLPSSARAEAWADLLIPEDAQVLASYDDPFLGEYAAITSNTVGTGRMTWLGTLTDAATTARVVSWALEERSQKPVSDRWQLLPATVRVTSGTRADGSRLWFVANHSWNEVELDVPRGSRFLDVAGGGAVVTCLALGAWDSRILHEV